MLPSVEQQAVIKALNGFNNVIVDSVAGSGKTTTVLNIAKTYPDTRILLLTYNSKLRHETRERAGECELGNLEVHTYHSFCVRYGAQECFTNEGIIKFLHRLDVTNTTAGANTNTTTIITFPTYDIIVLDECQDMIPLYYKLVKQILRPTTSLCVIGDKYQSIYGYAGADPRFITHADVLYSREFTRLNLNISYRVTTAMAAFINTVLGEERIVAVKQSPLLPKYTICDTLRPGKIIAEIKTLIRTGFAPAEIFILAPSVRSTNDKNPVKKIANKLSLEGIKIYVPMADDCKLDEDVIRGKLVFSSFHQAKGLERRAVIILGFDASYFEFFNKTDPSDRCPNTLYVAMTRAKEYLSVYHDMKSASLSFIDLEKIRQLAIVTGKVSKWCRPAADKVRVIGVTKLTEHIDSELLSACMDMLTYHRIRPAAELIPLPLKSEQVDGFGDTYYEEVSDINGVAIPALYEFRARGVLFGDTPPANITIPKLLELSNQFIGTCSGLNYKVSQIKNYNWLDKSVLIDSYRRCSTELSKCANLRMEVETSCEILGYKITGRMDAVCDDRVIEIKAVSELQPVHFIQLMAYGYCMHGIDGRMPKLHLFNIRTDELIEIENTPEVGKLILEMLVHKKFHNKAILSDEEFFAQVQM